MSQAYFVCVDANGNVCKIGSCPDFAYGLQPTPPAGMTRHRVTSVATTVPYDYDANEGTHISDLTIYTEE